jgi:lysophospholipase L1-like esterase
LAPFPAKPFFIVPLSMSSSRPLRHLVCIAAAVSLAGSVPLIAAESATSLAERFEARVRAYEEADKASPPPKEAILLAGDSQFFRWKTLHEDLPGFTIVNRGIDSFQTSDVVAYAERLVLPHAPRIIVVHSGGNDVNNGKDATRILADFKAFVAKVRAKYPDTRIGFSSITPSPGRWAQAERRREANRVIKAYTESERGLFFVDLWDALLTREGQPREDLWVEDRVHPNHAGYLIRAKLMQPFFEAAKQ